MPDIISATGVVGTPPSLTVVGNGLARLTFRLGSTQRKFNREASGWENGETNWYTVVAFRRLAENTATSVSKGERVVVTGRLRVNEWEKDGRRGTSVELIADSIGHDLTFGTSTFVRTPHSSPEHSSGEREATDQQAVGSDSSLTDSNANAVDADGWTLPGGARPESSETTDPGPTADVSDSTVAAAVDDADETDALDEQNRQLAFANVEPPF